MKNPIKIIHKFKNNNLRIQYKVFIFIGSLLDENIMKILKIIEDKDFINSLLLLSDKQIKEITNFYGEAWYKKFFTSYHINSQILFIKNNNSKRKLLESKMGKDFVKNLLLYVAIHEMAHMGCPEIGHGELFKKVFKFLTLRAMEMGIYEKEDYNSNPVEYCGMILSSSIV